MHGLIFAELKKYTDTKFGPDVWSKLLQDAGLGSRVYTAIQEYPDEEIVRIIDAACRATGHQTQVILQDFGEFIVPDLLSMFKMMIKRDWNTLDLIYNTEATIHRVVRLQNPGAKPPELICSRPNDNEVIVTYSSARKMCGLAKGIIKGVAKKYNERIVISEQNCMLKGDPSCEISVRLEG